MLAVAALAVAMVASCTPASPAPGPSESVAAATPRPATPAPIASPSPEPTLAWGPTEAMMDDARARAAALPLETAAGQVVVAALGSPDPAAAATLVASRHLGGVILMGDAITDRAGVEALTASVRAADDRAWPVWVSTDEEGGVVSRLRGVIDPMPAFMAAGAAPDKATVERAYAAQAAQIRALGIGVDYAPVADVTVGPADPIIRSRSAGSDVSRVTATVTAAVGGFADAGVVPVLKHFPGHGSVTTDSHEDLPIQQAPVAQLAERDLVPFGRAIDAGAPAVMVGHIAIPEWGGEPATLQPEAYDYLRRELGFTGVAVTDALNMGAIVNTHGAADAAVMALAAGADVLLIPADVDAAIAGIIGAVTDGRLPRTRLDEAVARMTMLLDWTAGREPEAVPLSDHAYHLSVAGITVASANCVAPFVGPAATVMGGPDATRAAVEAALRDRGIDVGSGGTRIALTRFARESLEADVVVALGEPFGLGASTAGTYVATYGDGPGSVRALAEILTGAARPAGEWPVEVPGLPYPACG